MSTGTIEEVNVVTVTDTDTDTETDFDAKTVLARRPDRTAESRFAVYDTTTLTVQ